MQPAKTPDLSPLPGWTDAVLPHLAFATPERQFLEGTFEEGRLRIRYYTQPDGALGGRAWFGPRAEGPPGHAHGGSIAAALDEAMGGGAWIAGYPVMTIEMTVRYRNPVPLNGVYTLEGRVDRVEGRKVHTVGVLRDDARIYATGAGIFLKLNHNPFGHLEA